MNRRLPVHRSRFTVYCFPCVCPRRLLGFARRLHLSLSRAARTARRGAARLSSRRVERAGPPAAQPEMPGRGTASRDRSCCWTARSARPPPGGRWREARDSATRWGDVRLFGDERSGADTAPDRGRSLLAPALLAASAARPAGDRRDRRRDRGRARRAAGSARAHQRAGLSPGLRTRTSPSPRVKGPARITSGDSLVLEADVQAIGAPAADSAVVALQDGTRRLARRTVRLGAARAGRVRLAALVRGARTGRSRARGRSGGSARRGAQDRPPPPSPQHRPDAGHRGPRGSDRLGHSVSLSRAQGCGPAARARVCAHRSGPLAIASGPGAHRRGSGAAGRTPRRCGRAQGQRRHGSRTVARPAACGAGPAERPATGRRRRATGISCPPARRRWRGVRRAFRSTRFRRPSSSSSCAARRPTGSPCRRRTAGADRNGRRWWGATLGRTREVTVLADGLWRWAFRGGSSEQSYRAWVAATLSWLLAGVDSDSGRRATGAAVVVPTVGRSCSNGSGRAPPSRCRSCGPAGRAGTRHAAVRRSGARRGLAAPGRRIATSSRSGAPGRWRWSNTPTSCCRAR